MLSSARHDCYRYIITLIASHQSQKPLYSISSQINLFWLRVYVKKPWRQRTSFLRHSAGWCHPFQMLNCSQFQPSSNSVRLARRNPRDLIIQFVHRSSWSPQDSPYSSSRPSEPINYASQERRMRWSCSYTVFSIFKALINNSKHGLQLSKALFCSLWDLGLLRSVLWTP